VRRVDDDHKRIQGVMVEQEKYLNKYRTRISELEAGQNERKRLELAMVCCLFVPAWSLVFGGRGREDEKTRVFSCVFSCV
jgi:hypothetical protein